MFPPVRLLKNMCLLSDSSPNFYLMELGFLDDYVIKTYPTFPTLFFYTFGDILISGVLSEKLSDHLLFPAICGLH